MGDRRGKLEIHHDILFAIKEDSQNNEKIFPTRVQFKSNLSYGKLKEFVSDMTEKKLLQDETIMKISDSGGDSMTNMLRLE
ncbi:MAG: winged helix-turn-helix domain-containing protein [Nitrosopumilus sp.]